MTEPTNPKQQVARFAPDPAWNEHVAKGELFRIRKSAETSLWQVLMPNGAWLDLDFHTDDHVHLKTARFIADACNAALLHSMSPVFANPVRDTADGIAYTLNEEPKPQSDYLVLYESPVGQLTSDVLVAWGNAEISEGRACELLGVDRLQVRKLRMDALGRVTGPIDDEALMKRRIAALEALSAHVDAFATDCDMPELTLPEVEAVRELWAGLTADQKFIALFEEWRALCTPALA